MVLVSGAATLHADELDVLRLDFHFNITSTLPMCSIVVH